MVPPAGGWLTDRMAACPTITTDRLILRPFASADLGPFHAAMTTDSVRAALHVPADFSLGAAWGLLCQFSGLWDLRGLGQWAVEEQASGRFVGRAGLYWRPEPDWPGVEVGWMLDPEFWGSGYASEAGASAVRYGFEVLDEPQLFSVILPENTRSQAVARRLGYHPGEERTLSHFPSHPHVVWRLGRDEWTAREVSGG